MHMHGPLGPTLTLELPRELEGLCYQVTGGDPAGQRLPSLLQYLLLPLLLLKARRDLRSCCQSDMPGLGACK